MDPERPVGARDVWNVVKASALRRIGRPLLIMWGVLFLFGVVVVIVSIVAMRFA